MRRPENINPFSHVKNELIKIKKNDRKNYPNFVRFLGVYYEIYRLELILYRGTVSKKMFDEMTIKLAILEEEIKYLWKFMIKTEKYYFDFLNKINDEKYKLEKKYRCKNCEYCCYCIIDYYDDFCDDCEGKYNSEEEL